MTEIKRPLSLQVNRLASSSAATKPTQQHQRVKSWSHQTSSQASCSFSSSSSSSLSSTSPPDTNCHTPETPSLILPYLYVGDQDQTQIDTISSLNISYILSLQSLPKFLDSELGDVATENEPSYSGQINLEKVCNVNDNQVRANQPVDASQENNDLIATTIKQEHPSAPVTQSARSETSLEGRSELQVEAENCDSCEHDHHQGKQIDPKKLLPSVNSSKDYLVKFRSCVHRLIRGKCINISDTFEQLIDKFFDETHGFIEEARRNRCNILVHCKAGISRSPTVAIAYLMKWKRLHLQDAYDFVKRCRPQISPNLNFMGQLMKYERRLLQRDNNRYTSLPSPSLCYLPSPRISQEDLNSSDNEDTRYNQPGTIHIAA